MKETKTDAYKEYYDTLNQIWHDNHKLSQIKYFLDTMYDRCSEDNKNNISPKIVVLGTSIPEELIIAAGAAPYFIIGGSLSLISWSDEFVPRDTDPVSRSILGYIKQPSGADFSGSLFIIPLISDSMRKIAYELKEEGQEVFVVDIPPNRKDRNSTLKWQKQMLAMTEKIASHMNTKVTKKSLNDAVKRVSRARRTLLDFLSVSRKSGGIITDSARQLISNSYYFTSSLDDWTDHLELLTNEIIHLSVSADSIPQDHPGVIILGSPVIFPNYKIPFLIKDIGLTALDTVDSSTLKNHIVYKRKAMRGSRERIISNIAAVWYDYDASSAFIKNDLLFTYVSWLVKKGDIEGVVYHVLKGQIEYDFELERFEAMLSKHNIPVFRLETDYQYQDVEQLRIRMEAFSEMLVQNRYKINRQVHFRSGDNKEVRAAS